MTAENGPRTAAQPRARIKKALWLLFLLTLPLANPWVRGDGVGYYAYIRSLLIDHDLQFENEWLAGNSTFLMDKVDENGNVRPEYYTPTGHVGNHFTVGPAILWAPALIVAHLGVKVLDAAGMRIPADGYSPPYVWTMALTTAFYGFLGLLLSWRLALEYANERAALVAMLGIWFGSSLPVYMYFNPSWSHAHSAFVVALFLWYWHRTRGPRSPLQWISLGLLGGLMINVYYPNAILLLVPLLESLAGFGRRWRDKADRWAAEGRLLAGNLILSAAVLIGFLPTLITRWIIYGSPRESGYPALADWSWNAPHAWNVFFSSEHGLLSWTPIVILAVAGLVLLWRRDRELSICLSLSFLAFYYLISCYASWHGVSSFGNRFFVSLTPLFVIGLAVTFERLRTLSPRAGTALTGGATALLILWNAGLMFQWGTQMIPPRGPISWRHAAYNQVAVVPVRIWKGVGTYFVQRRDMMERIEKRDLEKQKEKEAQSRNAPK